MRKRIRFLILAALCTFSSIAFGQIKTVQYWFNNDFANKTTQNVNEGQQAQLRELNSSHLSAGIHKVHIRAKDNNYWSVVHSQAFYKPPVTPSGNTMTAYEYWVDSNFSGRVSGSLTGGVAPIGDIDFNALSDGIHILHIRVKDARGMYSPVHSQVFCKETTNIGADNEIVAYEYWINGDFENRVSKTANGGQFIITNGFSLNSLSEGIHTINFRAKDNRGNWSGTYTQTFLVNNFAPAGDNKIDTYCYWYDHKYDERTTVTLPTPVSPYELKEKYVLPIEFNMGDTHTFHIQFRDTQGKWSAAVTKEFKLVPLFSEEEFEALKTFYHATGGDSWTNTLEGDSVWNLNSIATVNDWKGVRISEGRVSGIELPNNNLKGTLVEDLWTDLPNLNSLILNDNSLQIEDIIPSTVTLNIERQSIDEGSILVSTTATLPLTISKLSRYDHSKGLFTTNNSFNLYINEAYKTYYSASNGVVTIPKTYTKDLKEGDVLVLEQRGGTAKGTRYVFTVAGVPVSGIALNKTATSLLLGGTEQLTATITPDDASNKNVTWSSSNPEVASVVDGLVSALSVGTTTITVTSVEGGKTATCLVTVSPIAVTNVSLNKTEASLLLGDTEQLTATIAPANATNQAISWSSNKPAIVSVNDNGLVSALSVGTAIITVTTSDGNKTATCSVTVSPISVSGITLNKTETSLLLGDSEQLRATISPNNAGNQAVTWSSSNPDVASVVDGLVSALTVGTTTITATSVDGGKTATCLVTVNPIVVTGISLNKTEASLLLGDTEQLTATIAPINATNQTVVWNSSNSEVASVTDNGLVTALTLGTTTITVTTADGNKTASCVITVNPIVITGISLNKTTTSLSLGDTEQLTATISPINATNKAITWSSSNSEVASVNDNGLVSALAIGTATITVTTNDGNKTASCIVTVSPIAVTNISLNKTTANLFIGESEQLTYNILPENATDKSVTWNISNSDIASVEDGLVTGLKEGTVTITVVTNDGNKEASCVFTITRRPIVNHVEYFFDIDPGYGKAIYGGKAETVKETETELMQSLSLNIPLDSLQDGFHTLYMRARNERGWSQTMSRPFVKTSLYDGYAQGDLNGEYFFDIDPGYGQATAIEDMSLVHIMNIDIDSLADGIHTLYLRARNGYGWSHTMSRPFYKAVLPGEISPEMVYVEYYFDADPGREKGMAVPVSFPAVTFDFTAELSELSQGNHSIFIRGKYRNGSWDDMGSHMFTVIDPDAIDSLEDTLLSVYPNPVADIVFVKNTQGLIKRISVVDMNGMLCDMVTVNDPNAPISLNMSSYPSGTYILKIEGENIDRTVKVVKK